GGQLGAWATSVGTVPILAAMRGPRAIFAALVATALLVSGNAGLRALHLTVAACEAGPATPACAHDHGGHHHGHRHDDAPAAPAHDEQDCATCELLLTLATRSGPAPAVPTFLGLVAVADPAAPACPPAPAPLRALAARPPPAA
ncbi:MAG: hypothetical protein ACKOJI_10415, partial [Phycisphaerales bacterium]